MRLRSAGNQKSELGGISAAVVASVLCLSGCSNLGSPTQSADSAAMQRASEADQAMTAAYNDYIQIQVSPGDDFDASIAKTETAFTKLKSAYVSWDRAMGELELPETPGDGLPSKSQLSDFRLAMNAVINQNEAAIAQMKFCARDYYPADCIQENTGPGKALDVAAFQRNADRLAATREPLRNPPN